MYMARRSRKSHHRARRSNTTRGQRRSEGLYGSVGWNSESTKKQEIGNGTLHYNTYSHKKSRAQFVTKVTEYRDPRNSDTAEVITVGVDSINDFQSVLQTFDDTPELSVNPNEKTMVYGLPLNIINLLENMVFVRP